MLNWANEFLERCLAGIPEGRYARRLRKELEGHLAALEADLTAAGCAPEEAQAEAVRRMGDPAALNGSYRAEWRRKPERVLAAAGQVTLDLVACLTASLVAGIFYLAAMFVLLVIHYYSSSKLFPTLSWHQNELILSSLDGIALFLGTYLIDRALLRTLFSGRKDLQRMVTLGLLLTWLCEKLAILAGSSDLFGIPLTALPELIGMIAESNDFFKIAPWVNVPYCIWTLIGCFVLGRLFGGEERKKRLPQGPGV